MMLPAGCRESEYSKNLVTRMIGKLPMVDLVPGGAAEKKSWGDDETSFINGKLPVIDAVHAGAVEGNVPMCGMFV